MTDQQPTPDPAAAESATASPVPDPAAASADAATAPEPPTDDPGTPTRAGWATALLATGAALTLIAGEQHKSQHSHQREYRPACCRHR